MVILKMMFLLFYDNVSSERELMRIIPERLDYLWFLGYGLNDEIPDHSVLSKARARWGSEVFEKLFVRTVAACVHAGRVEGAKIHMDGSLIKANASTDAIVHGPPELITAQCPKHKVHRPGYLPTRSPKSGSDANPRTGMSTLHRNAGFPAYGFWGHSCPQFPYDYHPLLITPPSPPLAPGVLELTPEIC